MSSLLSFSFFLLITYLGCLVNELDSEFSSYFSAGVFLRGAISIGRVRNHSRWDHTVEQHFKNAIQTFTCFGRTRFHCKIVIKQLKMKIFKPDGIAWFFTAH
jgi:hypothetical protein